MPRSLDTPNGWYAGARRVNTPNFTRGRAGHHVKASTQHVTAGPKGREFASALAWLANPSAEASAHFLIDKDGSIVQFVSIHDTAWANGLRWATAPQAGLQWQGVGWYNARGKRCMPVWPVLGAEHTDPNLLTVSIEHAGQYTEAWTEPMFQSTAVLLRWIGAEFGITWVPRQTLIGHFELDTVDRQNCPGPRVEWERLATVANSARPDPWSAWGAAYPLPPEQRPWGIPQLWAQNARWLKEARSNPLYAVLDEHDGHNRFVVQAFQGGVIWGLDDQYQLIRFPREMP